MGFLLNYAKRFAKTLEQKMVTKETKQKYLVNFTFSESLTVPLIAFLRSLGGGLC